MKRAAFLQPILLLILLGGCTAPLPVIPPPAPPIYPTWVVEATPTQLPAGLNITADPRLELLSIVQALGEYDARTNLITDQKFAYRERIADHFAGFQDHEAVRLFDELSQQGFSFDAPPAAMLYLSEPPALAVEAPFTNEIVYRAGGPEKLAEFLAALRGFALDSDFMSFYAENAGYYQQIQERVAAQVDPADLRVLEDYYGMSQHSYNILLVSLYHAGGFGPRVERPDGSSAIYSINGPHGIEAGLPTFGSRESYRHLVWHEFSHSFINPLTTAHFELVEPYAGLMKPIRRQMEKQAYQSWETVVNEHIIRAVTARLAAREISPEAGEAALRDERSRGFRYVDALSGRLIEYETRRDQYPTLADFYPRLLEVLAEEQAVQ